MPVIPSPWLIGGGVAAFAVWTAFIYDKGGDARETALKASLAAEAQEAKDEDDSTQSEAASSASEDLVREIARLQRQLDKAYVPTGLTCDAPGSGDSVHDARDQLFEEGLPPVD